MRSKSKIQQNSTFKSTNIQKGKTSAKNEAITKTNVLNNIQHPLFIFILKSVNKKLKNYASSIQEVEKVKIKTF